MSHIRQTSMKRMYVEPHLFGYSDAEIARLDQIEEDRRNTPRERYCTVCHNSGWNCPECSGWDDEQQESDE
jgi:hypothetical protein